MRGGMRAQIHSAVPLRFLLLSVVHLSLSFRFPLPSFPVPPPLLLLSLYLQCIHTQGHLDVYGLWSKPIFAVSPRPAHWRQFFPPSLSLSLSLSLPYKK